MFSFHHSKSHIFSILMKAGIKGSHGISHLIMPKQAINVLAILPLPTYLVNLAPGRIQEVLGNQVKFVVILRNPIDRAYSHYLHTQRDQHENLSFTEALEEEEQRLHNYRKENDHIGMIRFLHIKNKECTRSNWTCYFKLFDRGQFYITTFDDFVSKQEQVLKKFVIF